MCVGCLDVLGEHFVKRVEWVISVGLFGGQET